MNSTQNGPKPQCLLGSFLIPHELQPALFVWHCSEFRAELLEKIAVGRPAAWNSAGS
jgi:hypothetical protein